MRLIAVVAAFLIFTACSAGADEDVLHYNIVNLDAAQSKQVANNVMVVVLQAAVQKNSAADAGAAVNEIMSWADSIIAGDTSVKHRTMNYQTRPIRQNKTISGWTVTQQLRLQSENFENLTNLVGTLQQQLQVASMHFEVSPELRKQAVDGLITAALGNFRDKAKLVTHSLEAKDYRVVNLSIRDNAGHPPYRGGVQMEAMAVRAAAPVVEAGDSTIQVTIQGKIQLTF